MALRGCGLSTSTPVAFARGTWIELWIGVALRRKSWLFASSERGGDRAVIMYSLTVTAKLNDIDPQAPPGSATFAAGCPT